MLDPERRERRRELSRQRRILGRERGAQAVDAPGAEIGLERRLVQGHLLRMRDGVGLAARESELLVGVEHDPDRPPRA